MRNFSYLLGREFGLFWKNKVFVFAFLVLPLLLAIILGYVYKQGKVKRLPVVVVDKDFSPSSIRFRAMLEDNDILHVVQTCYEAGNLHQLLLEKRAVALVEIPYRFEAGLLSGRKPEINCYLNVSNTLTSNAAGNVVSLCAATMNAGVAVSMLQKKGLSANQAMQQYQSFKTTTIWKYNPAGNYLFFLWPALIFSVLHQLLLLALAVSFSGEHHRGEFTSNGLLRYNHSAFVLILVKLLPYCLLSLITVGLYFLLSFYFRLPQTAYPFTLLLSQFLFISGAGCLGILYSILNPLPLKATQLLMSISSPAFTVSGFTWPSDQAPVLLREIGQAIPLTPYLRSLRMMLLQKGDWNDILSQLQHQLILVLIFFFLSVIILHFKIHAIFKREALIIASARL